MDARYEMFLWGLLGSVAVEVLRAVRVYEDGKRVPARYSRKGFWIARVMLAMIGGAVTVAYNINSPILAFHIGAATPSILESLSKNPPNKPAGKNDKAAEADSDTS